MNQAQLLNKFLLALLAVALFGVGVVIGRLIRG